MGSPLIPQRISSSMPSTVSRRQRFIALIFICCVSFFIFAFYIRTDYTLNSNEIIVGNIIVDRSHNHGASDTAADSIKKTVPSNTFIKPKNVQTTTKVTDMEMALSRSAEYDDIVSSIPVSQDPDEVSGPPKYEELASVIPSEEYSNIELEVSGPTEVYVATSVGHYQPKLNIVEIEKSGSKKPETYEKLTLDSTTSIPPITKPVKNPGLIIDTPQCKIPKLDPWDPTVAHLIEKQDPYKCPGPPLFMKSEPDGSISLNKTVLKIYYHLTSDQLVCHYRRIARKHEDSGNVRENDYIHGDAVELKFGVPLNEDYVSVSCIMKSNKMGNKEKFLQYFPLVRLKKEIENERDKASPPTPRLNVILAGIDSVSKLNFLRHFPRTHHFLKKNMSAFEMKGYTKVGDNTFPNLVPLLTGHFVEYYWNESLKNTMYFDNIDLIWKVYAKQGFRTFYAEDSPHTGTFNYLKRGFYDPPTDYYFRPIGLALAYSKLVKTSKAHCLNSQIETDIIYDYLKDFLKAMNSTRPHISFAMVSTITHDYLNQAGWADEPTVRLLEDLSHLGALNNSMLVLFSDHGLRFGKIRETYIGKFEERMPFMFIHFPKWFLEQYPDIAKNLHDNQERLITLFDIHATMVHLLNLSLETVPEEVTRGSSLLNEITSNRTCEEANILPHWCPCQTFESVPLNDTIALNAIQAIVDDINRQLEPYKNICEVLAVDRVMDARLGQANDLVLRFVRHDNVVVNRTVIYGNKVKALGDYLLTLTTKPGGAVFEGTVRHDPENNSYTILGISRINLYGKQSICVDSQKMKIFCYCKG